VREGTATQGKEYLIKDLVFNDTRGKVFGVQILMLGFSSAVKRYKKMVN